MEIKIGKKTDGEEINVVDGFKTLGRGSADEGVLVCTVKYRRSMMSLM